MGEREGVNEHGKDLPAGHDPDRERELEGVPTRAVYHDSKPNKSVRSRPCGGGSSFLSIRTLTDYGVM